MAHALKLHTKQKLHTQTQCTPSSSQESRRTGELESMAGVDRISALPIELKTSILCRLDFKYALRTSALSRSWRHVWTLLPKLTAGCFNPGKIDIFLRKIDHALSSLRGPILEFGLFIEADYGMIKHSESVQRFLDTIFQKGALHILWVFSTTKLLKFRLPQFDSLKELHIGDSAMDLPEGFKGFKCLATLDLYDVFVSAKDLELLVNGSRKLTSARLFLRLNEPLSLTISLPLLTQLKLKISDYVRSVKVGFAPCLQKVSIVGEGLNAKDISGTTMRFVTSIASVTSLTLDYYITSCLSFLIVPAAAPLRVHFNQLKSLKLSGKFSVMNRLTCNMFCSLLKSMPSIERLDIQKYGDGEGHLEPIPWNECKKRDGFCCLNQTLKTVRIVMHYFDSVMGVWIPQFLLLNANVLKLMEIKDFECTEAELKAMEELHQIKLASPDAKLVILPAIS